MVRGGIFVSTENNGLRFDIYERVNLPENVAAIEELEEIELVPRIQVIDQGEFVLLQGQLVLNGIYRGEGFGQEQIALEHWIPVEISLPMSRVQQLEEITVDIDTFHVEPVSDRALNITGVLALRGIYLEAQEQQHWGQEQHYEQFSFVAEADASEQEEQWRETEESRDNWFVASNENESETEQLANEWREFTENEIANEVVEEEVAEQNEWQTDSDEQIQYEYIQEVEIEDIVITPYRNELEVLEAVEANDVVEAEEAVEEVEEVEEVSYANDREAQTYYAEANYAIEESETDLSAWQATQPEVTQPEAAKVSTSFGIKDLLSTSLREQAVNELQRLEAERERLQQQILQEQAKSEPIDWHQILLQPDGKEQFRRIKMYIVQKHDTLEQIAGKYDINPRDLLSHNKLSETAISEGQLLYIP